MILMKVTTRPKITCACVVREFRACCAANAHDNIWYQKSKIDYVGRKSIRSIRLVEREAQTVAKGYHGNRVPDCVVNNIFHTTM